jgi:peroxiredoxin
LRTSLAASAVAVPLIAASVILMGPAGSKVRAAETTLKPWTDDRLPLFSLDALTGERTDLAQLRGRVVLVHFFATWCEPCRAELTSLQNLAGRMQDKPLTVIAVDAGEVDGRVQRFFATLSVPFPVLLDRDRAVSKAWQVYALPTTFLLDSNLVPRFVAEGDFDWSRPEVEEALMKLIASKATARDAGPAFAPL